MNRCASPKRRVWWTTIGLVVVGLVTVSACSAGRLGTQTATINWADQRQRIDGFGASSAYILTLRAITDAQADMFFDPAKGIGLSLLRTQIQPDGSSTEIVTAQKAIARGAKVWASPWSPPASYKTNGSLNNGGHLKRSEYSKWAARLAGYVQMMQSHGVPIYAVSVQNEPDITQSYPSCRFTAGELRDFVPYLSLALRSARLGATRIMLAEQSQWAFDLVEPARLDPNVSKDVGIIAAHYYGGEIHGFNTGHAPLWETEVFDEKTHDYDGSIGEGLPWAATIHRFLTVANANAWHWWSLMTDDNDNGGLTDLRGNPAKRMYVLGHWSKFVRPGWYRIGIGYSGLLQITAFKDAANLAFAIVAVNPAGLPVSQAFSLNGFSADAVTPWITSADRSLSPQTPVSVREDVFQYTLPASSITTFSGQARVR